VISLVYLKVVAGPQSLGVDWPPQAAVGVRGPATPSSGLGGGPVKFGELKNMPLDQMKVSVQEKQCGRHHGIP
jgi:hypothetical protein